MARRSDNVEYSREERYAREAIVVDAQIEIQRLMEQSGITQKQLAGRMGVTESYVSQFLGASARNLTLRTYASIMFHLGEEAYIGVTSYVGALKDKISSISVAKAKEMADNVVEWRATPKRVVADSFFQSAGRGAFQVPSFGIGPYDEVANDIDYVDEDLACDLEAAA